MSKDITDLVIQTRVERSYGGDPVVGKSRLGIRDNYVPTVERTLSGREDYALAYKLRCKALHKGVPNSKRIDSEAMAAKKAAIERLETVYVEKPVEPIERKPKFVFDRSNKPARPHGPRERGYVAKGRYTGNVEK